MFAGTVIEELFEIVERAEDHAHTTDTKLQSNQPAMYPGFLANVVNANHDWMGVI
jgi:hypothetical protein